MMPGANKNRIVAAALIAVAGGMVGLAYASVPLYRLFCQVTGYGGTTQRATAGADHTADRTVVVRFDGNVAGLPWNFRAGDPAGHAEARRDGAGEFLRREHQQDCDRRHCDVQRAA